MQLPSFHMQTPAWFVATTRAFSKLHKAQFRTGYSFDELTFAQEWGGDAWHALEQKRAASVHVAWPTGSAGRAQLAPRRHCGEVASGPPASPIAECWRRAVRCRLALSASVHCRSSGCRAHHAVLHGGLHQCVPAEEKHSRKRACPKEWTAGERRFQAPSPEVATGSYLPSAHGPVTPSSQVLNQTKPQDFAKSPLLVLFPQLRQHPARCHARSLPQIRMLAPARTADA